MLASTARVGLLSFWQTPEVSCVAQGGEFYYPPLARAASVQGIVVAHVLVGEEGMIALADYQGPPLLIWPIAEAIMAVRFPTECACREVDLHLKFQLVESGEQGSRTPAANEWLVSGHAFHTVDTPAVVGRRPWWKRIFGR
jgi:hypothetical protein